MVGFLGCPVQRQELGLSDLDGSLLVSIFCDSVIRVFPSSPASQSRSRFFPALEPTSPVSTEGGLTPCPLPAPPEPEAQPRVWGQEV